MASFQYQVGQNVSTVGNVAGACIIARGYWESLGEQEPRIYYDLRLGDKTFTVSEAQIIEAEES